MMTTRQDAVTPIVRHLAVAGGVLALVGACWAVPQASAAQGRERDGRHGDHGQVCSQTARTLFQACGFERQDAYWVDVARCLNVTDAAERGTCYRDAAGARRDHAESCQAQLDWRLAACDKLGDAPYDPEFDAVDFEKDYTHPSTTNPYFPLTPGTQWIYQGGGEVNRIKVTNRTKRIDDIDCLVVHDQVFLNGSLKEDTEDWYAQHKNGDVWYCGEEVKDYESFDGDRPRRPELVKVDGSFKAGRNGDKPGVIFRGAPRVGEAYLEEFSLGNAEDVTEILSASYTYGLNRDLDEFVPAALARLLCAGEDCVVTKNYSLLEPGVIARKYYAPGVGFFLEVKPDQGLGVQLVSCTVDVKCSQLPQPR
jgi:hypothetical protein